MAKMGPIYNPDQTNNPEIPSIMNNILDLFVINLRFLKASLIIATPNNMGIMENIIVIIIEISGTETSSAKIICIISIKPLPIYNNPDKLPDQPNNFRNIFF